MNLNGRGISNFSRKWWMKWGMVLCFSVSVNRQGSAGQNLRCWSQPPASAGPTLPWDVATDKLALLITVQRTECVGEYNITGGVPANRETGQGRRAVGITLYRTSIQTHLFTRFYRTVTLSVLTFTQWLHNSIGCNSVTGGGTEGQQTNAQYTTPWKTWRTKRTKGRSRSRRCRSTRPFPAWKSPSSGKVASTK